MFCKVSEAFLTLFIHALKSKMMVAYKILDAASLAAKETIGEVV